MIQAKALELLEKMFSTYYMDSDFINRFKSSITPWFVSRCEKVKLLKIETFHNRKYQTKHIKLGILSPTMKYHKITVVLPLYIAESKTHDTYM